MGGRVAVWGSVEAGQGAHNWLKDQNRFSKRYWGGMANVFQPRANGIAKATVFGLPLLILGAGAALFAYSRSGFWTRLQSPINQPVPFSHQHHVAGLGIDCRYCHMEVERSSFAGIPANEICMTCHSQVWKEAPVLEPLRESWRGGPALRWNRVYDLPDYVYFDHSIHVNKGVACQSCHGRVDQMPLTRKAIDLQMRWCLGCHREPETQIRPKNLVTAMLPADRIDRIDRIDGVDGVDGVRTAGLTDCYTCHR